MDSAQSANGQQFCLRWHNHQTSLLSSLPLLLDQSHLTDVTISAEGRTVRAHRVVLSACSTFFSELFRTLEPPYHPVIVLPGASFNALVSLLSFMYSGEVNVSEEQIPTLLLLAETLGIKGLADFNGNAPKQMSPKRDKDMSMCDVEPAELSPPNHNSKVRSSPSLESLFNKPQFPFFPLLPAAAAQPLNFSQHSARLATDLFNKFNNQLLFNQHQQQTHNKEAARSPDSDSNMAAAMDEDIRNNNKDMTMTNSNNNQNSRNKMRSEYKKIDKIAENLRTTNKFFMDHQHHLQLQKSISSLLPQQLAATSPLLLKPPCSAPMHNFLQPGLTPKDLEVNIKTEMNCAMDNNTSSSSDPSTPTGLMSKTDLGSALMNSGAGGGLGLNNNNSNNEATNLIMDKSAFGNQLAHPQSTGTPPGSSSSGGPGHGAANAKAGNSKLFATCFICHKQLSNQYNLRVHLETHQNVRYACTVCTHVSRSKDALRKHVSYRHPGAPSPCESETRRKRNKMMNQQQQAQNLQIKQEMIEVQNFLHHHQQQQQQQLMALAAASSVPASPAMSMSSMGMPPSPQLMPSTPPVTPNSTPETTTTTDCGPPTRPKDMKTEAAN